MVFWYDSAKLIYIEISIVSLEQVAFFLTFTEPGFETITYNVIIIFKNVNKVN